MKRFLYIAGAASFLAACVGRQPRPAAPIPAAVPAPAPTAAAVPVLAPTDGRAPQDPAAPPDPNFILTVTNTVTSAEEDGASYAKVVVDGAEAGKTATAPSSEPRVFKIKLPEGNRLIRVEYWLRDSTGSWKAADAALEPRERFARVVAGFVTNVDVHFGSDGAVGTMNINRVGAP